jgi:hypothetical protein
MPDNISIFINEQSVSVPPDVPVRTAVEVYDPELAVALAAGTAYITDGVGRTITPDRSVAVGDILRVVVSAPRQGTGSGD